MNKEIMARNINKYLSIFDMEKQELAEQLGVSCSAITGWTNGKYYPRIDYIERMATIFHCKKSDLIEDKEKQFKSYDLTAEEYLILEAYRNVDDIQKEMVKRILNYSERLKELEKRIL